RALRNVSSHARLDPVRVVLTPRVRPLAAAEIRPTAGGALDPPRQLLRLDPEEAAAVRRAGRIERERLADDDRALVRQQPALCLVHGPRDSVEAGRDVDDRRPREALVTIPARRFGKRVVDLHLRAAVAEAARAFGDRRGHVDVGQQALVELRRRPARDAGAPGLAGLAAGAP